MPFNAYDGLTSPSFVHISLSPLSLQALSRRQELINQTSSPTFPFGPPSFQNLSPRHHQPFTSPSPNPFTSYPQEPYTSPLPSHHYDTSTRSDCYSNNFLSPPKQKHQLHRTKKQIHLTRSKSNGAVRGIFHQKHSRESGIQKNESNLSYHRY